MFRRVGLTCVVVILVAGVLGAMQWVRLTRSPNLIVFSNPFLDSVRLGAGEVLEHRFEYVNASSVSSRLVKLESGCSCLSTFENESAIAPGGRGSVRVRLSTNRMPRGTAFQRNIVAQFEFDGDARKQSYILGIGGLVAEPIACQPAELSYSGEDGTAAVSFTVERQGLVPELFSALRAKSLRADMQVVEIERHEDSIVYEVRFLGAVPFQDRVEITFVDASDEVLSIYVPVRFDVSSDGIREIVPKGYFSVVGRRTELSDLRDATAQSISVVATEGVDLKVLSATIDSGSESFAVDVLNAHGGSQPVQLAVYMKSVPQDQISTGLLRLNVLNCNSNKELTAVLPLRAFVSP